MSTRAQERNTHDVLLDFGKYEGERLTRVPVGYVRWMIDALNIAPAWRELARSEYSRRATALPTLELSSEAIDDVSLHARQIWRKTASNPDEGLYSWLMRVATEAMASGEGRSDGTIRYIGLDFAIGPGDEFPAVKAVSVVVNPSPSTETPGP